MVRRASESNDHGSRKVRLWAYIENKVRDEGSLRVPSLLFHAERNFGIGGGSVKKYLALAHEAGMLIYDEELGEVRRK